MNVILLSKQLRDGEAISEYTKNIAEKLVEEGHEATIISFDDGSYYSLDERVDVVRFPLHFDGDNIYNWAMMMNNEMKGQVVGQMDEKEFDLIHANDWTTVPGAVTLSKHTEVPLVTTIHSTENERGFSGEHAEMISELEWQGAYESDRVLVTKEDTKNSVLFDLDAPEEKVDVIDPLSGGWQERVLNKYREVVRRAEKPEKEVKN
jgi:glycogen(starch) synthase